MDECVSLFVAKVECALVSIVVYTLYETNIGSIAFCGFNLRDWGAVGEADKRFYSILCGCKSNSLSVVAGRASNYSALLLLLRKLRYFVV